jgi:hypothetical protein
MEILLQEVLFTARREAHTRCEPKELGVLHPEDGGDIFFRNTVISQKTALFIVTAVKTSNYTSVCIFVCETLDSGD